MAVAFVLDPTGKGEGIGVILGGIWGAYPSADLIRSGGKAYGTNIYDGAGGGTIFRWFNAVFDVLYSFQNGLDGQTPNGTLVRDTAGNLYGTTSDGGAGSSETVFKLDPSGKLTVLYKSTPPKNTLQLERMGTPRRETSYLTHIAC